MHLIASGSVLPLQQPKLVCQLGLSKRWDAGQATASLPISELHLLSFRRFLGLGCWQHHALQDREYATRYKDITPVFFHNCVVIPAVFGIFLGAYLPLSLPYSRLGGIPYPTLAFTHSGWGMHLTRWLISYLAGCVAATLISLLTFRVCCCHPHYFTHYY